jgi:uncharacterized membrane protein (DUF2068 family)
MYFCRWWKFPLPGTLGHFILCFQERALRPIHCTAAHTLHRSLYITPQPVHCTAACTLHHSLYITPQPVHYTAACTLHRSLYITPQPVHYTALHRSLYITPQPVHYTAACTLHRSLYITPQPVHWTVFMKVHHCISTSGLVISWPLQHPWVWHPICSPQSGLYL